MYEACHSESDRHFPEDSTLIFVDSDQGLGIFLYLLLEIVDNVISTKEFFFTEWNTVLVLVLMNHLLLVAAISIWNLHTFLVFHFVSFSSISLWHILTRGFYSGVVADSGHAAWIITCQLTL